MFNRKSQTILSDHYTKLIDHSDDDEDDEEGEKKKKASTSLVGGDDEDADDFMTIKRRDHDLNDQELPSSSYLSKRKLKQGQSKKAMLSHRGNPTKLVFDDEGDSHALYELGDLEDFEKQGDASEQQKKFVEAEKEKLKEQDIKDKERQKELRREKKRKRKEIERGVSLNGIDSLRGALADVFLCHLYSPTENLEEKKEDSNSNQQEKSFTPISTTLNSPLPIQTKTLTDLLSTLPLRTTVRTRRNNVELDSRMTKERTSNRKHRKSISKLWLYKLSEGGRSLLALFLICKYCRFSPLQSQAGHEEREFFHKKANFSTVCLQAR
jgi:ATP-dependent RNA helicase DDX10/DBP4